MYSICQQLQLLLYHILYYYNWLVFYIVINYLLILKPALVGARMMSYL